MSWSTLVVVLFSNLFGLPIEDPCSQGEQAYGIEIACEVARSNWETPAPPPEEEEAKAGRPVSSDPFDSESMKTRISNGF